MRLDVLLVEKGIANSRTEAQRLIKSACVKVCGINIIKPSFNVDGSVDDITVDLSSRKYVSRGGLKLEAAIEKFGISVSGRECIDIGASSGGFTDCLLSYGAKRVIAIDSGTAQLADSLRKDRRVISIENYNARYMKPEDLPYVPELCVMDVSFISATYIIPAISRVLKSRLDFICLIKPQFEVGRVGLSKGGIVKYEKSRMAAVDKVVGFAASCGFVCHSVIESPIKGGDGNIEFLAHFQIGEQNEKNTCYSQSPQGQ